MIFCFSGTGNSRYLANRIAEALSDTVIDLNTKIKANDHTPVQTDSNVIVVAPTYAWRIPRIVTAWADGNGASRRKAHLVRDELRR